MTRLTKSKTGLPSIVTTPLPQRENSEAERSKNLGLEVVQFMGSPAGLALGTVVAGLVISWFRRRSRSRDSKTGTSTEE